MRVWGDGKRKMFTFLGLLAVSLPGGRRRFEELKTYLNM